MNFLEANCEEHCLPAAVARMTASDGLPFQVFAMSVDIRKGLEAQCYSPIPKSGNNIQTMAMNHGDNVRAYVAKQISLHKANEFSLTFDEWTSTRNRRYLNINVHEKGARFWNRGMCVSLKRCLQKIVLNSCNKHSNNLGYP